MNALGRMLQLQGRHDEALHCFQEATRLAPKFARAWEFLARLISLAIPRIRDFRGLSAKSFDGHGNYTFGINDQLIFPEIDYDRIDTQRGFDVTIVTTARTDDEGRAFLSAFGFPFRQETR